LEFFWSNSQLEVTSSNWPDLIGIYAQNFNNQTSTPILAGNARFMEF